MEKRDGERKRENVLSGSFLIKTLVILYQGATLVTSSPSPNTVTFGGEGFNIGF